MLADTDLDLFEMANLYPETTGLPMTIWASPSGKARHDARVKVNNTHGRRPSPRLVEGSLTSADQAAVAGWITRNRDTLVDYWDGTIDTATFVTRLSRV